MGKAGEDAFPAADEISKSLLIIEKSVGEIEGGKMDNWLLMCSLLKKCQILIG